MASAIASDPVVAAALWTGLGALALSVLLVLAVFALRLRFNARAERERRFAATWRPLLAACAERVPETLPPIADADAPQFLALWTHAQEAMLGDTRDRLLALARRVGADRHAVELLDSGRRRHELLALAALGHLGLPSTRTLADRLLEDASPVLSMVAAQALLRIDPIGGLPRVLKVAAGRDDWPVRRLAALLAECGAGPAGGALSAAIQAALEDPARAAEQARLLRLVGVAHLEVARPLLARVFESSSSPDAIAAALDALAHPEDARWARAFATHGDWVVRVAAAKALARTGTVQDRDLLAGLLCDSQWWVRYRAAQALARLPGMSAGELRALGERLGDRYAADMLAQVIAETAA